MSTDSIVRFNYSDGVPLLTIYIKSDSHLEKFIPILQNIVEECDNISKYRAWSYVVAEIVSKLIQNEHFHALIKICHIHFEPENCNTIFRHVISIKEEYYLNNNNLLKDFVTIETIYPITGEKIANCLLFKFPEKHLK